MTLFARLWTGLVQLLNIGTLSPVALEGDDQVPLLPKEPSILPIVPGHVENLPPKPKLLRTGPVFTPPGTQPGTIVECDYSNMIGWEICSDATDRTCWLKNPGMGQFEINTDYEALRPHGIMRNYTLDVTD